MSSRHSSILPADLLALFAKYEAFLRSDCRVGGGGGPQPATSARPTEPLVQFSRKRLSMGVALLAVVFTHAGNQLQKVDQPVFTVEAGLR